MKVEILLGPEDGEIREKQADKIVLGRKAGNDIFFTYARKVSEPHASITKEGNNYYLTDHGKSGNGSTNGTVILKKNGEQIKIWKKKKTPPFPGEQVVIEPDDIIILGDSIWLKFLGE